MGASLIALGEEDTWRKALHRPQPERDGGFIASTDGPVVKFVKKMGWKKEREEKFQEHYSRVNVHTQLP